MVRQLVIAAVLLLAGCRQILGIDGEASALDGSMTGIAVGFTTTSTLVDEDSGTVQIEVSMSEPSAEPVTVKLELTGGSAMEGADYAFAGGGTLGFSPGETSQTIAIDIVKDLDEEADETIELALSSPTGADLGISTHSITISTDILPRVAMTTATSMGMENASTIVVVTLSAPSPREVTVQLALSGTAAPADHTVTAGVLTFPPGVTSHDIELGIVDDTLDELDETLVVTLAAATNAIIVEAKAHTHSIVDNDAEPTLSLSPAGQPCPEGTMVQVTGRLSALSGKPIDAQVTAVYESASAQDAMPVGGTSLAFAPGEMTKAVTLQCTEDPTDEPDETLRLQLGAVQNAQNAGAPSLVTVVDNDAPSAVFFDLTDTVAPEGNFGTDTFNHVVKLDRPSAFTIVVPFTVDGTAAANDFSVVTTTPITFTPGEVAKQLQFRINGDNNNEQTETVMFILSDTPTNATRGNPGTRTHTIANDD